MIIDTKKLRKELDKQGIIINSSLLNKNELNFTEVKTLLEGNKKATSLLSELGASNWLETVGFPATKKILESRRDPFIIRD